MPDFNWVTKEHLAATQELETMSRQTAFDRAKAWSRGLPRYLRSHAEGGTLNHSTLISLYSDILGVSMFLDHASRPFQTNDAPPDIDALMAQCWLLVVENHRLRKELADATSAAGPPDQ